MTVNPNLPVSILIASTANPVCAGIPVIVSAYGTNGGTSPVYQWKVNGANVGSNSASFGYSPNNGDIVTCVMTSNATCVSGNPATSNQVAMVVSPVITSSVSISASQNNVCSGTSVTFTPNTVGGGSSPAYQWIKNNVLVATSVSYTYTPVNGDVVNAIMTSNSPCATGIPATSNKVTMVVNPLSNAGTISGTSPLCIAATATYASNGTSGGSWSSTNTAVASVNATTGVITAISAGTTNITYTVTSGCGSPVSAFKSLTINAAPTVAAITGTASVTVGSTTQLSDATAGGTWSSANQSIATVSSTGLVTGISAGNATISYTVSNGCGTVAATRSVAVTQPLGNRLTTLSYTGVSSVQYYGQASLSATLRDSRNGNGLSGKSITFTIGSQVITAVTNGSGRASVSLLITQAPGNYNVIVSFAGDATYLNSSHTDPFTITRKPATAVLVGTVSKVYDGTTVAHLSPANYSLTGIVSGDVVSLNNPPTGTYSNRNVGNNKTVTVTGLALTGANAAKYILTSTTVSANIGIISTSLKSATIIADPQPVSISDLKVYPNPASGPVTFEFNIADNAKATLDLFSMAGKRIATIYNADVEAGIPYKVIYTESLAPGVYVYILRWNNQVLTGKLIIIRKF
jgi:hypothetical protein